MQVTIWGSEATGRLTINADGTRVTLTRDAEGKWKPSSEAGLRTVRETVRRELGAVLAFAFDVNTMAGSVRS